MLGVVLLVLTLPIIQGAETVQEQKEKDPAQPTGSDQFSNSFHDSSNSGDSSTSDSSASSIESSAGYTGSLQYSITGLLGGLVSGASSGSYSSANDPKPPPPPCMGAYPTAPTRSEPNTDVPINSRPESFTSLSDAGAWEEPRNHKYVGFGTTVGGILGATLGLAYQQKMQQAQERFTTSRSYANRLECDDAQDCMQKTLDFHLTNTNNGANHIFAQIIRRALNPEKFAATSKFKRDKVERAAAQLAEMFEPVLPNRDGTFVVATTKEIETRIMRALEWDDETLAPATVLASGLMTPEVSPQELLRAIKRVFYRIM
eukprot:c32569_g1_i1.p1 GENE.c32569_g1_i1~~c32569_g1_i1.p1  ORF type:complete len:316 (+),score=46.57 c32569_g1_i1:47-994(+)